MKSGIYVIENLINGKKYVGQSINVEHRLKQKHRCSICLLQAINKYGKENFKHSILEYCEKDKLDEREIYWIKNLNSHVSEHGYNMSFGGKAFFKNKKHSEKAKEKIKLSSIGRQHTEEFKEKLSNKYMGKGNHAFGKKNPLATSAYFGVCRIIKNKILLRWKTQIRVKSKLIFIGVFEDEILAAKAYDQYVVENNLPNPLNFPEDYQ